MILLDLLATITISIFQFFLGKQKLRFDDELILKITFSIANLDMAYYDCPDHYNQTKLLYQYSNSIIGNFNNIIDLLFSIISLTLALILITSVNAWLSLIAIISVIPSFFIRRKINIRNYTFEKNIIKDKRYVDYLSSVLVNKAVIREFQIFQYESYINQKIQNHQNEYRTAKIQNSVRNAKSELLISIIEKVFSFAQQILLIISIVNNSLTIGDYSYIGGATAKLKSSMNQLLGLISEINITDIQYKNFIEIINRKPFIYSEGKKELPQGPRLIEFRSVSFKYPNSDDFVIDNISFIYDTKEKIALVGQNGSGKSTLVKLLLRFYDPSEGEILLNGINIKEYDIKKYRGLFSVMFQDPLIYALSIEENIALDHPENLDRDRVTKVLEWLDLESGIDVERQYGREYDLNGYVFSIGQQQRLYAARTLYHSRNVFILDEPSSSMDALAEYNFFNTLGKCTQHHGLIYITHRYGILSKMNNILVLDHGKLIEQGKHSELINKQGVYYKMYKLQEKEFKQIKETSYET